jgi:uncharacterized protein (TIGR00730 family)
MTKVKSICIFCGSSPNAGDEFITLARDVGASLARNGFQIIYGGARIGLMGAVAESALKEKGKVIGVLPHFLKDKEIAHLGLSELHLTNTMHERQMGMAERADAFLVLPGGLGTLAEFFEILTWKQVALHDKPIMLINHGGYWDSLLDFLAEAREAKFLRGEDKDLFVTLENIEAVTTYLQGL